MRDPGLKITESVGGFCKCIRFLSPQNSEGINMVKDSLFLPGMHGYQTS